MKRALVVGIDDYDNAPLSGCVNDAIRMSQILGTNGDGSPNFDVKTLTSNNGNITCQLLDEAIEQLFTDGADTALLYFAGHGIHNDETNQGYLVTQDGRKPNFGISISSILERANKNSKMKSTIIILDSCNSGAFGEVSGANSEVSHIGSGLTILTACHRSGYASETSEGHGKFTSILLDGLQGSASDILGRITPASLYAHVDQTLGAWEQRPIYKTNVQTFVSLREVSPKVSKDIIRKLPDLFPNETSVFKLDPSFEPDRGEQTRALQKIDVNEDNVKLYRELQQCNRHGLIVPVDQPHMWHAAIHSTGCKLTATGAHYRNLAKLNRI